MTQPAKSQEPSMEEILASIRRIIADDDATKSAPKPADPPAQEAAPPPPPPPPRDVEPAVLEAPAGASHPAMPEAADILELTESMAAASPPPPAPPSPQMELPQFRTIDGSSDVGFAEPGERPDERGRLISKTTSEAVDTAFNALAQTVLMQNARTLEDLVREMLRPMLKTWLDDNLPSMVERLVRAEIERVSRGRPS